MKHITRIFLPGLLLVILALLVAAPVQAAGLNTVPGEGKVIFGGNYTLPAGQTLDGDLAVFGGNADLQTGSTVLGSAFLAGGNLSVSGEVRGDVVLLGGNLSLSDTAVVTGDVNTIGGVVTTAPGAQILGDTITSERPLDLALPHSLLQPRYSFNFDPIGKVFGWFFQGIALAALAMIVVLVVPNAANRSAATAVAAPVASGGIGILTSLLFPAALLLMIITIIGIPVALLAILAVIAAVIFGWIALGLELGRRMAHTFNARWSLPLAAGLGTLVLSLVANGIGFIACVGWLAPFLVSMLGLGAVILTRFGSQVYPPGQVIPPVSPYGQAYTAPPVVIPPSSPPAAVQVFNSPPAAQPGGNPPPAAPAAPGSSSDAGGVQ